MTYEEYKNKMDDYSFKLNLLHGQQWDKLLEEISLFQQKYMNDILDEYEKKADSIAKKHIYNLLSYAVKNSESGNSIIDVESKEISDEIENIIWQEIGNYLLDYQVYKENNQWIIDCMFAGYYVPHWNGWND